MKEIKSKFEYEKSFPPGKKAENALHHAHEIRKFEIELYWKRAAYFWTLIAAAFAGYFVLIKTNPTDVSNAFIVACIGVVLSVGWFQVNRGSKYWQSNWERHVDCLEDEITGPLYKTILAKDEFPFLKFWDGYSLSVSKTNQLISFFIVFIWVVLMFRAIPGFEMPECVQKHPYGTMVIITSLFVISLFTHTKSGGADKEKRYVNFKQSKLSDKK